jgi:hypothetical protein
MGKTNFAACLALCRYLNSKKANPDCFSTIGVLQVRYQELQTGWLNIPRSARGN